MAAKRSAAEELAKRKGPGRSKRAAYRSLRFLRAVLDEGAEALLVLDEEGEVRLANRKAGECLGCEPAGLAGRDVRPLFPRQLAFVDWGGGGDVQRTPVRVEAVGARGEAIPLEVVPRRFELDGETFRILSLRPLQSRGEEELIAEQARVFRSLEGFAAGLAHEFNNVLTGIMGNLHLAMEESGRRGRMEPALLEGAYNATLRAREITRELGQLAGGERPVPRAAALPQLVRENSLLALAGSKIQVDYDFAADLRAALLDPGQIGQVLHQLLTFGADVLGRSGQIRVRAANYRVEPGDAGFGGELLQGDYVALSMELDGRRWLADEVPSLFEPYRSPHGAVSGLALAVCRSVVRRHGGLLKASAMEGGDLSLQLYLPACRDLPNQAVTSLQADARRAEGCRILVMDDEQLVRLVLRRSLEGLGHRVEAAADGEEALALYEEARSKGERFDVVFLDLRVAGGRGGKETCRDLLELDPLATCILMSGDNGDEAMLDHRRLGFAATLEKPFQLEEVGRVLDRLAGRLGAKSDEGRIEFDESEAVIAMEGEGGGGNIVVIDFTLPPDMA